MKFLNVLTLATVAIASPIAVAEDPVDVSIEKRATGTTAKEFTQGGCRDIIFIFARGSGERGNLVGPATADGLKAQFGESRVAAEGVDYRALLTTNFLPGGADPAGIAEMERLINLAASRCPSSQLVVGGYSQGAAVTHGAVEDLSSGAKDKIKAAILFGDTQNRQDGGRIPNFDTSKTRIICNDGDDVCNGTLNIRPAHLDYARRVPEAVSWIVSKLR